MNNKILSEFMEKVKPEEDTFKVGDKSRLMTPDYTTIGNRIKEARMVAGLTQAKLAEKTDLSQAAINRIEGGYVSLTLDNLYKFSEVLNRPITYFLGVGTGTLDADEAEWLQFFREMPPGDRPTIAELLRGYAERLRRR